MDILNFLNVLNLSLGDSNWSESVMVVVSVLKHFDSDFDSVEIVFPFMDGYDQYLYWREIKVPIVVH